MAEMFGAGGGDSALSMHALDSRGVSFIIFIFTGVASQVLVLGGSQVDTFLVLLLVLFLWVIIYRAMQSVSEAMRMGQLISPTHPAAYRRALEDQGWSQSWDMWMGFVSYVLMFLTFQVAGQLILQEWVLAGVTTQETLVLLLLIALVFFPVYLWVHRIWMFRSQRAQARAQGRIRAIHERQQQRKKRLTGGKPAGARLASSPYRSWHGASPHFSRQQPQSRFRTAVHHRLPRN